MPVALPTAFDSRYLFFWQQNTLVNKTIWSSANVLAQKSVGLTDPNPRVGCVITDAENHILGSGHTQPPGGPHAEIMALQDAQARGHGVRGATAWVTLEPCCHFGRTPPCTDALLAAGIATVKVALPDPNPLVAGKGIAALRAAGVAVEVLPGSHPAAVAARELNLGFLSRMARGRPWVRLKIAASLDGKTALNNGRSQWITSEAARLDGHVWRARASALLTGIGTVLEDDPRLDVRGMVLARQPPLAVVDSRLETPVKARLFAADRLVWLYAAQDGSGRTELEACGAHLTVLPDARGKVDLAAMLTDLAKREVNELHVEAGHKLNGSLIRAGLADEFLIYLAPSMLGQARDMAQLGPFQELSEALSLEFTSVERIGPDLRIIARPSGRDKF